MFIFTDSCTCRPFSAFLPVLAVFRQCFGYFLLEYHISRVPFSVDINTNDVNFAVVSISWIISCSSFPMTFPRLIRAREWWILTKYVYYFTWPSNNCLQIMVCSCAMSSNFVWLQIIFCSCANETTYTSRSFPKQKYRDLSVSRRSVDLLATDKSRYFAQWTLPIVYWFTHVTLRTFDSHFVHFSDRNPAAIKTNLIGFFKER